MQHFQSNRQDFPARRIRPIYMYKEATSSKPSPITLPGQNGVSHIEAKILFNSLWFMNGSVKEMGLDLTYMVIGDGLVHLDYAERLHQISEIKKFLGKTQDRLGIPRWYLDLIELHGKIGLHSNVFFVSNAEVIRRLRSSEMLAPYIKDRPAIQKVEDRKGGFQGICTYMLEEASTQARQAMKAYGIPVPEMKDPVRFDAIGDRLRQSDQLRSACTSEIIHSNWHGCSMPLIPPYSRTNWDREKLVGIYSILPEPKRPVRKNVAITLEPEQQQTLPMPSGQLLLFPELAKPVSRLKDFHGGIIPPSVALELEYRRRQAGLSQAELGKLASTSQPQISNAIDGRFGMSRQTANRIKQVLGVAA